MADRWCLQRDDASGHISVLINDLPVLEHLKDTSELKGLSSVGHVENIEAISATEVKITFTERTEDGGNLTLCRKAANFCATTLFCAHYFKDCSTPTDFQNVFQAMQEAPSSPAPGENEVEMTLHNEERTPAKEPSLEKLATPEGKKIDRKRIGKYKLPIDYIHTPDKKRKVRDLDESFVKKLEQEMLNSLVGAAAPPLLGFIDVDKDDFDEEKLKTGEYKVEAIDGNHSIHAMKNIKVANGHTEAEREVIIYAKLKDEECLKLGINRNKCTSTSLKMKDYDYMKLLRDKLTDMVKTDDPTTIAIPDEFTRFMHSIMDLKTKAEIDSKGTLRFLVTKLTAEQFSLVCDLFKRSNKTIPMSRFRPLHGLPAEKIDQLLADLHTSALTKSDWDQLKAKCSSEKDKHKGNSLSLVFKNNKVHVKKGDKTLDGDSLHYVRGTKRIQITLEDFEAFLKMKEKGQSEEQWNIKNTRRRGTTASSLDHASSDKQKTVKKTNGEEKPKVMKSVSAKPIEVQTTGDKQKTVKKTNGQEKPNVMKSVSAKPIEVQSTGDKQKIGKKANGQEKVKHKVMKSVPAKPSEVQSTAASEKKEPTEKKETTQNDPDVYEFHMDDSEEIKDYTIYDANEISTGQFVAIKSAVCMPPEEPYPWIAKVENTKGLKTIQVKWWVGDYYSTWTENEEFKNCKLDTVRRDLILTAFTWESKNKMPEGLVTTLQRLYGDNSDEEEDD